MRFSLHIFFALAALGFVTAAAILGASAGGFSTATPGGASDQGQYQQASLAR